VRHGRQPRARYGPGLGLVAILSPLMTGLVPGSVSIVLPAYNEEANIERAVTRALEVLGGLGVEHEVIVVDDGSRDLTSSLVEKLVIQHHPKVRLLVHTRNHGYGAAIRTGFGAVQMGLVFFTDADNQFDIGEIAYFIPQMEAFDVLTGFRVYRYDTVVRSMLSWIYNRMVGVMFRVRVRDVDCAFKLFRREVVDQISIETDNFFVATELMAKARKWNFRIGQKGVRHYPRISGETTVRPSDIPRTLREMAMMWQRIYAPSKRQKQRLLEKQAHYEFVEFVPPAN
jgi:glycosyltransferase involved in cell wall biosynthesis